MAFKLEDGEFTLDSVSVAGATYVDLKDLIALLAVKAEKEPAGQDAYLHLIKILSAARLHPR